MAANPSPGLTMCSVPIGAEGGAEVDGSGDGERSDGTTLGEGATEEGGAELDGVADGSAPPHAARNRTAARPIGPRRVARIGQFGW